MCARVLRQGNPCRTWRHSEHLAFGHKPRSLRVLQRQFLKGNRASRSFSLFHLCPCNVRRLCERVFSFFCARKVYFLISIGSELIRARRATSSTNYLFSSFSLLGKIIKRDVELANSLAFCQYFIHRARKERFSSSHTHSHASCFQSERITNFSQLHLRVRHSPSALPLPATS